MLLRTYNRIREFAQLRMGLAETDMSLALVLDLQRGK